MFEITDGGIVKYTKGGNAFSKTLGEENVIRPHTDPYKLDDSGFGLSLAVSENYFLLGHPLVMLIIGKVMILLFFFFLLFLVKILMLIILRIKDLLKCLI